MAKCNLNINMELIQGHKRPERKKEFISLIAEKANIIERATESDLPVVDFWLKDENGGEYCLTLTGRIVNGLSAVIKGVNLRNHGNAEP